MGMVFSFQSVSRPAVDHGQPLPLTSPESKKLSSVTNWLEMRWKFGVIWRPKIVRPGSPFAPLVRSPSTWSKVRFSLTM